MGNKLSRFIDNPTAEENNGMYIIVMQHIMRTCPFPIHELFKTPIFFSGGAVEWRNPSTVSISVDYLVDGHDECRVVFLMDAELFGDIECTHTPTEEKFNKFFVISGKPTEERIVRMYLPRNMGESEARKYLTANPIYSKVYLDIFGSAQLSYNGYPIFFYELDAVDRINHIKVEREKEIPQQTYYTSIYYMGNWGMMTARNFSDPLSKSHCVRALQHGFGIFSGNQPDDDIPISQVRFNGHPVFFTKEDSTRYMDLLESSKQHTALINKKSIDVCINKTVMDDAQTTLYKLLSDSKEINAKINKTNITLESAQKDMALAESELKSNQDQYNITQEEILALINK